MAVAARADARPVQVVAIKALRAVARRVARDKAHRVVRHVRRTAVVAMTSRQLRTAMIGPRVAPAAAIAAVRAVPTRASHVRIRRARTIPVRRVMLGRASRMGKGVRRVQLAHPATQATPPSSAAGTFLRAWILVRARDDRAAIRMRRVRTRDVRAPVVRVVPVDMARRAVPASMPDRTSSGLSPRARKATDRAEIVRTTARHAARTRALPAPVPKDTVPPAIVRAVISRVGNTAVPAARRRTRVRMGRAQTDPTPRAVRDTKGCRATRIESPPSRSGIDHLPMA